MRFTNPKKKKKKKQEQEYKESTEDLKLDDLVEDDWEYEHAEEDKKEHKDDSWDGMGMY